LAVSVGTKLNVKDFQAMKKLLKKRKMTSYKWIQELIKKGLIAEENPKTGLIKENNPHGGREPGRDTRCPWAGEEKEVIPSEEKEDNPESKKEKYVKEMEKELQDAYRDLMKIVYPPK